MEQSKRYCPKCLIRESRNGQRYCRTCHAEYMRQSRLKTFSIDQISKAFNRETMSKDDFMSRLRK